MSDRKKRKSSRKSARNLSTIDLTPQSSRILNPKKKSDKKKKHRSGRAELQSSRSFKLTPIKKGSAPGGARAFTTRKSLNPYKLPNNDLFWERIEEEDSDETRIISEIQFCIADVVFGLPDEENQVVYNSRDTFFAFQSISLEKLVEKVTSDDDLELTHWDVDLNEHFIMMHSSFCTSEKMLLLLKKRFTDALDDDLENKSTIILKVFNLIKFWILHYYEDWSHNSIMGIVLIDICKIAEENNLGMYSNLVKSQFQKQRDHERENSGLLSTIYWDPTNPPICHLPSSYFLESVLDCDTVEISRQLTLLEHALLKEIKMKEITTGNWQKKDKAVVAPGVTLFINHFNRTTNWIESEILKCSSVNHRLQIIQKFLEISEECLKINNYNTAGEIYCGLNTLAIGRLKKTWDKLKGKHRTRYQHLQEFFNQETNYALIREELDQDFQAPGVPFLSMYLSDVGRILGSTTISDSGLIHFDKLQQIAALWKKIEFFASADYNFLFVPLIRDYIFYADVWTETTILQMSLHLEPNPGQTMPEPEISLQFNELVTKFPAYTKSSRPNPRKYSDIDGTIRFSRSKRDLKQKKKTKSKTKKKK